MTSYSKVMANMLGSASDSSSIRQSEPRVDIPLSLAQQQFELIPEAAEYTAKDAAIALDRPSIDDSRAALTQSFLQKSPFWTPSAFSRLIQRQKPAETPDKVSTEASNNKQRWTLNFYDPVRQERRVRDKSNDLHSSTIKAKSSSTARSKWQQMST